MVATLERMATRKSISQEKETVKMTNRQYMIELLNNEFFFNDNGKSYESMLCYHISCPYYRDDERCHCKDLNIWEFETKRMCCECKQEWLESEMDDVTNVK